jgi:hypothetical protein
MKLYVYALNVDLDATTVDIRGDGYAQGQDAGFRRLQLAWEL